MSKTTIVFFLIVILASLFRLTNLNLIEFKADEAINLFLASRPVFGHQFPPGGTVSSVGIPNAPLFNYLLFPIVFFTTNPKIITFFIGLTNVLTVGFLFLFIKRYYGLAAAIVASSFIAVSPWAILYSRKIWAPDMLFPFLVGLLWSSHKIAIENKKRHWITYCFFSLLLVQLHQSSLFFLTPLTFFLFMYKPSTAALRYILFGLLLGLIPLLPFLRYEIQNRCPDCSTLIAVEKKVAAKSAPTIFLRNLQILGTGYYTYIFGVEDFLVFQQSFPFGYQIRYLFYINYLLLPIGMYLFYKQHKKSRFLIYATISLSFLYYFLKVEPVMHYFIIVLPLLFLFLSYPFLYLFDKKPLFLKGLFFVSFAGLFISYCIFNLSFISFLKTNKGTRGDYGPIYFETEKNIKKNTAIFMNEENFSEITTAYLVPPSAMIDNLSLARMLYPIETTEKNMASVENQLQQIPQNPLAQHEIVAYYRQKINRETINSLRDKANKISAYKPIYNRIYNLFLDQRLKKAYTKSSFPITFEYPSHWTVLETFPEKILIRGDFVTILIINLEGKNREKNICITKEKNWCGTTYAPFTLASYHFITSLHSNQQLPIHDRRVTESHKTAEEILDSLRIKNEPL